MKLGFFQRCDQVRCTKTGGHRCARTREAFLLAISSASTRAMSASIRYQHGGGEPRREHHLVTWCSSRASSTTPKDHSSSPRGGAKIPAPSKKKKHLWVRTSSGAVLQHRDARPYARTRPAHSSGIRPGGTAVGIRGVGVLDAGPWRAVPRRPSIRVAGVWKGEDALITSKENLLEHQDRTAFIRRSARLPAKQVERPHQPSWDRGRARSPRASRSSARGGAISANFLMPLEVTSHCRAIEGAERAAGGRSGEDELARRESIFVADDTRLMRLTSTTPSPYRYYYSPLTQAERRGGSSC